jgi:Protein of unknown function (DUF3617)
MHSFPYRFLLSVTVANAAVALSYSPVAALEIEPGLWQSSETHTVNGKTEKPEITTDCVSAREARDPVKALSQMKGATGGECHAFDVKQTGNVVSFVMKCGDPKAGAMDMAATFTFADARHYKGAIKTEISIMGHKTTSDMTVDAQWIGACKQ